MGFALNVLTLSEMFPCSSRPNFGIFVYELVRHTARYVDNQIISPVAIWPGVWRLFSTRFKHARTMMEEENLDFGIVHRKRYAAFPRRTPFYPFCGYSAYNAVRGLVDTLDFDLIHAHQPFPDGYVGMLLKRRTKKPLVVTVHGDVLVTRIMKSPALRILTRDVLAAADAIIVVASYQHKFCHLLGVSDQSKVFNIPNGVDVERFRLKQNQRTVRESLGLPTDKKILLFLGNLYAPKGLPILIDSLIHLGKMANVPPFNVVIVGDGPLKSQLERQVVKQQLSLVVRFVGNQPHKSVPLWLNAADVMVLPSLQEGFPTVIPEALAAGRPVVTTRVGGIPDVISSDEIGFMVEPGDSMALASALGKALRKDWNYNSIAQYGSTYSWDNIAVKTCEVYRQTLETSRLPVQSASPPSIC